MVQLVTLNAAWIRCAALNGGVVALRFIKSAFEN